MEVAPETLDALAQRVTNAHGATHGPFIETIWRSPGWSPYVYTRESDRRYRISTTRGWINVEAVGVGEQFEVVDDFGWCGFP